MKVQVIGIHIYFFGTKPDNKGWYVHSKDFSSQRHETKHPNAKKL